MDAETSSAEPRALFAYANAGLNIDAQLEASASRLAGVLDEFAATCREYSLGINSSLAQQLQAFARRTSEDDLWVRRTADGFLAADAGDGALVMGTMLPGTADASSSTADSYRSVSPDAVGTWPRIEPTGDGTISVSLDSSDVAQYLTPVADLDVSTPDSNPWSAALGGLQLLLKAASETPTECNDAFNQLAQAIRSGPDAVRDSLQRSRPLCRQSRTLVRLTTVLADGTPIDLQQEMTLDEFAQQMTAAADSLGGGGSPGRNGWTTPERGAMNNRVGSAFENILDSMLRRLGKFPFFRPNPRRAGFDLVTIEQGNVVINEAIVSDVVVNEAKFQNRLQYADFTALTVHFRTNVQQVLDSLSGTANLSAAEKELVRTTLEGFLRDGTAPNLRIRVITGKATVGPRLQASLNKANPTLPLEIVDVSDFYPSQPDQPAQGILP
jgi:hypothetical protein